MVEIASGAARLALAPEWGGAIAALSVGGRPVLRSWTGDVSAGPFALASNILLPFSNRISGGGFSFDGIRHSIPPNLDGEALPIHGDAFQRAWQVAEVGNGRARLDLADGAIGPFRYSAQQRFRLTVDALLIEVMVRNDGSETLPFGCGFHPWFPRTADTRLGFEAGGAWTEDARHLPVEHVILTDRPDLDFASPRPLPDDFFNMCFTQWTGRATIRQGPRAVGLEVSATEALRHAIVYSPGHEADFFCFEPVSHPVDAFNIDGRPGLEILAPGQTLVGTMTLAWL